MRPTGVASPWWVQWFYRITKPLHPRGWVEFTLVDEDGSWIVRTIGLRSRGLPELEMLDVPPDLLGPVHGIFMALMDTMARATHPIRAGEKIGGKFVRTEQTYIEVCTLHAVRMGSETAAFRICDVDDDAGTAAPRRLIATHLCVLAESAQPNEKLRLLTRATEIYPVIIAPSEAPLEDWALNPNNFAAWEGLGNVLADRSDAKNAIQCWRRAVCHWPVGGLHLGKNLCARLGDGRLTAEESVRQFWCELSPNKIREFCRELGIGVKARAAGNG